MIVPTINQSVALGWQLLRAGNIAAADEAVRPLLAHGISDEMAPLVGAIRLQQGRHSEAAPMFERARALHPREVRFAFLHGKALTGMDRFDEAVSAFQAAIKLEPNIADTYLALGQAQRKLKQFEDAQDTYRKLLRLQSNNVDGHIALSSVLAEMGQFAEAETALRRALLHVKDKRTEAAVQNNLAILLSTENRHAEALESLDRTQALAPDLPDLDQRRIDRLYQLGRYEDCLVLYRKLLGQSPTDVQLHKAYNSLLYRLGRMDEFLTSYDRAPQTREILFGKARFLSLQKRSDEVEALFNTLLARDPLDGAALSGWADNLMAQGRNQEALAIFESVLGRPGATPGVFSAGAA